MTQLNLTLAGSSTSRSAVGIYYLFNPGTGVKSVVVTPGGSSTKAGVQCQMVGYSNVSAVGAAQTSAATSHSPTSVASGYDVRVLGNGATLTSPNQTQDYLNGASVSGVGDWMTMQSAAGTGSTISFTCSGTATTPQSVATALSPILDKAETFTDAFTDLSNWGTVAGSASVVSNQVNLPTATSGRITRTIRNDLRSSYAFAQLIQTPTVDTTGASGGTLAELIAYASNDTDFTKIQWDGTNGTQLLEFEENIGGVQNLTSITYDSNAHKFLQIRESGGTTFWETSATGQSGTWTTQRSKTTGHADGLSSVVFRLVSERWGTGTASGTAIFDNFNIGISGGTPTNLFFNMF